MKEEKSHKYYLINLYQTRSRIALVCGVLVLFLTFMAVVIGLLDDGTEVSRKEERKPRYDVTSEELTRAYIKGVADSLTERNERKGRKRK